MNRIVEYLAVAAIILAAAYLIVTPLVGHVANSHRAKRRADCAAGGAVVTRLPEWADNAGGRALVSAIIEERPGYRDRHRLPSIYGGHIEPMPPRYIGKTAARLRKLHDRWLDRQLAALDAQFAVSGHWDADASHALFAAETGDQLIERVLRETDESEREAA